MKTISIITLAVAGLGLSACASIEGGQRTGADRFVDAGQDNKHLSQLVAGIWVDPNGCATGLSMMV